MLSDFIVASMTFSAKLTIFEQNEPK